MTQSTEQLKQTYETIADDYYSDHVDDAWDDDFIEIFSQLVGKDAHVLDLGCGPGIEIKKLTGKGLKPYGFDLSKKFLEIAQRENPTVEFTQGDMRHLPYADVQFDGVFAKASLLHIPKRDIKTVIDEISRVLKPNGVLHVAVKQGDTEKKETEDDYGYEYTRFFSYWSPDEFKDFITASGYSLTNFDIVQRQFTWIRAIARKR